jgi:hypothetical protein
MGMRVSHQAAEDRMALFLDGKAETTACWASRRQWLVVLHRLVNTVLTEDGIVPTPAQPRPNRQTAFTHPTHAGLVNSIRV